MPTIRIDREVFEWLQSLAEPFEDTPNSVLRRVGGLASSTRGGSVQKPERQSAVKLAKKWKVNVKHQVYHWEGTFFENLKDFPGALFDLNGYVVITTEEEYQNSRHLRIGQKLNVAEGISSIPGYQRMGK